MCEDKLKRGVDKESSLDFGDIVSQIIPVIALIFLGRCW